MKNNREKMETPFFPHYNTMVPDYNTMEAICCYRKQRFLNRSAQNLMQPFPTPMMIQIKIDYDWHTGLGDIDD